MQLDVLKAERDRLKEGLRELDAGLRKAEADLKLLRQKELQTKREIEALTTLIDIKESKEVKESG